MVVVPLCSGCTAGRKSVIVRHVKPTVGGGNYSPPRICFDSHTSTQPSWKASGVHMHEFRFPVDCLGNPVLRALMRGFYSPDSPLRRLRGWGGILVRHICQDAIDVLNLGIVRTCNYRHILHMTRSMGYEFLGEYLRASSYQRQRFETGPGSEFKVIPASYRLLEPVEELRREVDAGRGNSRMNNGIIRGLRLAYSVITRDTALFPAYKGNINVNMMPYVIGDDSTIPRNLRGYLRLIDACPVDGAQLGKVGYLTIQECTVAAGSSQRRPGLHVETPGKHLCKSSLAAALDGPKQADASGAHAAATERHDIKTGGVFVPAAEHPWGVGMFMGPDEYIGGIYMASNVSDSCEIYDAQVEPSAVGLLGDVEHVRPFIGPGYKLRAGELTWFTDTTPHEALRLPAATKRQYFRLVTSAVGVWYAKHSTPNPLVKDFPPPGVRVVDFSKFD